MGSPTLRRPLLAVTVSLILGSGMSGCAASPAPELPQPIATEPSTTPSPIAPSSRRR